MCKLKVSNIKNVVSSVVNEVRVRTKGFLGVHFEDHLVVRL